MSDSAHVAGFALIVVLVILLIIDRIQLDNFFYVHRIIISVLVFLIFRYFSLYILMMVIIK
ncbi:YjcZ family sporulation protein [Neobacillus cucumis]|uniref:YjcZ family sporulation protein n=1 Tax=Neobacillus cucumis TaxID=1740721 RepID=UPI00399C4ED7